ncbi:MAG: malonic semialdehyde reductase [Alphaproteobacteria bacterium]|nr:malonic semialdehyde reductase [Alphaproteobacteria bacterium]
MLDQAALDSLFTKARSHNDFDPTPVPEETLHALYDLMKMGPTSANCCPARLVFVTSQAGKKRLMPFIIESNIAKVEAAPVVAIIANDTKFYDRIPELFPHNPEARNWFTGSEAFAAETAMRNGSMQAAYLMLAARALDLDVGPMSGFDVAGVNQEFFPDGQFAANLLCNIGHGRAEAVFERLPRLAFDDACKII